MSDKGNTIGRLYGPTPMSDVPAADANPPIVAETPEEAAWLAKMYADGLTFETTPEAIAVAMFDPSKVDGVAAERPGTISEPARYTDGARVLARRAWYDEQFTLIDGNGRPMPETYYTLRVDCGSLVHGTTDSAGRTARYKTNGAQQIALYLGHRGQ